MTQDEFKTLCDSCKKQIDDAVERTIPIAIGVAADNHTKANFRKGGFVNDGLQAWTPAKRIGRAKGAQGGHKTLMSGRMHLYDSTHHRTEPATAIIYNDCEYAAVHNEGLHAGRGGGFTMPKRQFIGESKELNDKVVKIIDKEITKILKI
ncbi:MAG: phage virion morphogenesis protein [Muribaculaceae bacterium]